MQNSFMLNKIILSTIFLLTFLVSDHSYGQQDTYLSRETFGLVKSKGWDIAEYSPGKYLTLLDGLESFDSLYNQISFLGKHESNGIVSLIDKFNYGVVTIGIQPKLYNFEDSYFSYTRGTDSAIIFKYDRSMDTSGVYYSIDIPSRSNRFHDILTINDNEIYGLLNLSEEGVLGNQGRILHIKDKTVVDVIELEYPDVISAATPMRMSLGQDLETIFVASSGREETGSESFLKVYIQEYSKSGEVLWEYLTPKEDFFQMFFSEFIVDDLEDAIYLAGQGTFDLPGWVMKIQISTGEIIWQQKYTQEDFEDGYKQGVIRHLQFTPDRDNIILSGRFRSNDNFSNGLGFISKMALDGEVLWTRTYKISDSSSDDVIIESIRPTSDGGYICIGGSELPSSESSIPYATVLLKVDSRGIVEGITSAVGESVVLSEGLFSLYPNPSSSLLQIQHESSGKLTYRITDNLGREYDQFTLVNSGALQVVDVSDYPAGNYVVTVSDGTQILKSELIVVSH